MNRRTAFALVDLVVLVVVTVVFVALAASSLGDDQKIVQQAQANKQLRAFHTGLVIQAQGNDSYYLGLNKKGDLDAKVTSTSQGRCFALIDLKFLKDADARSPFEAKVEIPAGLAKLPKQTATSFAMEQFVDDKGVVNSNGTRINEWKDTTNTDAPILSDRLKSGAPGKPATYQSLLTDAQGQWRGGVAYNDNHVNFESKAVLTTKFGLDTAQNNQDDLFIGGNAEGPAPYIPGNHDNGGEDDALMVWSGTTTP